MIDHSLWGDPWIPVVRSSGKPDKLGLRDALAEAHLIRELFDSSPLVPVAIHRLLIALLYRIFNPQTDGDWAKLWQGGQLPTGPIDSYGAIHADRFSLHHPSRPFYQVPEIEDETVHPISALVMEAAAGNNPTLFDHGLAEGADALTWDRAACHLVTYQSFALGGGVSKPFNRMDAPLAKGMVVEAMGRSLFETLLLNTIPVDWWTDRQRESDRPAWEIDSPQEPRREGTAPLGPMHYLTWQSRQLHLVVDAKNGLISGCQIRQRYALPKDGTRIDPAKPYSMSEKEGWQPFRLQKHRAAWQYTNVLLISANVINEQAPPTIISWLARVQSEDFRYRFGVQLPAIVSLNASGLTTAPRKAAKVDLWRRERLPIPSALLEREDLVAEIDEMLAEAWRAEALLNRTARGLAWALSAHGSLDGAISYLWTGKLPKDKMPDAVKALAQSFGIVAHFWPAIAGSFRRALVDLPTSPRDESRSVWCQSVQQAAVQAFQEVRNSLVNVQASFEVLSRIEQVFRVKLSRLFTQSVTEEADDDEPYNDEAD